MFRKDLQSLQHEFEKVGNPYFEDTKIVYTLVTKNEMIHLQTNLFMRLELLEQNSILHAKKENIGSKSIYETIKHSRLSLYENTNTVVIFKTQKKVASLQ